MPKLLITGGLGFIFSHVTEYFVTKGWDVVVIDFQGEGSHKEIINGSFKYHLMDVSHIAVVDLILKENPDFVIHAAAISDVDYSIIHPYEVLMVNAKASINVFEACRILPNLKKLIYIGTDEMYGECEHKKKEDEILFPRNAYSASKAIGTMIRMAYDSTYPELHGKTAETRFCNVFGPRQDKRKIFPAIKASLFEKYVLPLHNGGAGYREYIYVKNIPPAIELILEKGDQPYNITTNDGYTVLQIIALAEDLTGKKCRVQSSQRLGMDKQYQMDNARITELGFKPLYSFQEGLNEYLNDKTI